MSSPIDGSGFFRGITPAGPAFVRPPWSLPEAVFLALCTGCGGCRDECPRGLLQKDTRGLPFVDFSQGACDFCGECVDACARGALTRRYHGASWGPWQLKARVSDACLGDQGVACRQCIEECHVHAIHLGAGRCVPAIDVQRCNGCGACFTTCPSGAIGLFDPASA